MRHLRMFAVATATVLCGCSLVGGLAGTYRLPDRGEPNACSDGVLVPELDAVTAALGLGLGAVVIISELGLHTSEASVAAGVIGVPLLAIGGVFTGSSIYGFRATSRCHTAKLHDWLDRARALAHAGDCPAVRRIDQDVRESDPEFHDETFARDLTITGCLAR